MRIIFCVNRVIIATFFYYLIDRLKVHERPWTQTLWHWNLTFQNLGCYIITHKFLAGMRYLLAVLFMEREWFPRFLWKYLSCEEFSNREQRRKWVDLNQVNCKQNHRLQRWCVIMFLKISFLINVVLSIFDSSLEQRFL